MPLDVNGLCLAFKSASMAKLGLAEFSGVPCSHGTVPKSRTDSTSWTGERGQTIVRSTSFDRRPLGSNGFGIEPDGNSFLDTPGRGINGGPLWATEREGLQFCRGDAPLPHRFQRPDCRVRRSIKLGNPDLRIRTLAERRLPFVLYVRPRFLAFAPEIGGGVGGGR